MRPSAAVVVATVRALKYHGGVAEGRIWARRISNALEKGLPNLLQTCGKCHTRTLASHALWPINRFPTDTEAELAHGKGKMCRALGVNAARFRSVGKRRRRRYTAGTMKW